MALGHRARAAVAIALFIIILDVPIWLVLLMHVIFFYSMVSQPVLIIAKVTKGIRLTN